MNTQVKRKTAHTVRSSQVKGGRALVLSPSGIKAFESCEARYLYQYHILPRIDLKAVKEVTKVGRTFHELASIDFDARSMESILAFERKAIRHELEAFSALVKQRDYFAFPARTEVHMVTDLKGLGTFQGYADRVCKVGDKVFIVDLKTSANPDPAEDRKQVLAYAFLLCRNSRIAPGHIELILDYVREDELYRYSIESADIKFYEHYLKQTFKKVMELVDEFKSHLDISKVTHTTGSCFGCPVIGICQAYRLLANPVVPVGTEDVPTKELLTELIEREDILKLYDARVKALRAALIERHKAGDEKVSEYYRYVVSRSVVYPGDKALEIIVNDVISQTISNPKPSCKADIERLVQTICATIGAMLPENLTTSNIPEGYTDRLEKVKSIVNRSPYLKRR